jgi:hypothetical protein
MTVPGFLAHLPTDRIGRPVPWINKWGAWEDPDRFSMAWDPFVQEMGCFYDDDLDGPPDFKAQNPGRQRQSMMAGLCQICGLPVEGIRWLPVHPGSLQPVMVDGVKVMVTTEPWVHQVCGLFAVDRCPALIRSNHARSWSLRPVTGPDDYRTIVSRGWIDSVPESVTAQPAVWVKVQMLNVTYVEQSP